MEWLSLPLALVGLALIFHGFPNIHIGTKKYYNKNNKDDE